MPRLRDEPIQVTHNPYRGPNAHLLSLQQTPRPNVGLWHSFHSQFIVFITETLTKRLPKGYIAINEQSLQIQVRAPDEPIETLPMRYPDIAVYTRTPSESYKSASAAIAVPDLTFPYVPPDPDVDLDAVLIYQITDNDELRTPIVRLELFSPSNKRGGDVTGYLHARQLALASGTILYELDLLHETESPLREIPIYPTDNGAYPYYLAVTNPRETPVRTVVKGFHVDDPFPPFNILLLGEDRVADFDLTPAYNRAFETTNWADLLDYADDPDPRRQAVMKEKRNRSVPPAIATYSPADQARIAVRMQAVYHMVETSQ